MASTIHLVRHSESEHNVSKNTSHHDPSLTPLGHTQASQLTSTFPNPEHIAVVLTSPLRRAIQTTLVGFSHVLDKRYFDAELGGGIENGVELRLEPDLQERSDLPCDTGSARDVLEKEFPNLALGLGKLSEGWPTKEKKYAADDEAVTLRAARTREKIRELSLMLQGKEKRDIVIVTHGVFMKFLSGDGEIDLPKAGCKSYTIGATETGETVLVPV